MATESANDAAAGGALIPMLMLGFPGDAVTAIMIGALILYGFNPGPMLMLDEPDMFWFIDSVQTLSNIFMPVFGLPGVRAFTKVVEMPRHHQRARGPEAVLRGHRHEPAVPGNGADLRVADAALGAPAAALRLRRGRALTGRADPGAEGARPAGIADPDAAALAADLALLVARVRPAASRAKRPPADPQPVKPGIPTHA